MPALDVLTSAVVLLGAPPAGASPSSPTPALLADPQAARETVRLLSTVTLASLVLIIGVGMVAVLLLRRHRRRLAGTEPRRRRKRPPPDPWFESGRRVSRPPDGPKSRIMRLPGSEGGSDDDTVDIDPDELGPDDVDDRPPGSRGG